MNHLYFAYGSNLDLDQMSARCPESRLISRAKLSGYRLGFTGHGRNWNGAVATVLPAQSNHVFGLVWSLSDTDLDKLDRCEGYPHSYT